MTKLDIIAFAGASNWPVWAGQARGVFAEQGLELTLALTPNSRHMARALHSGAAAIALTSIDNVIAYASGQGEEPLGETADFFAFMGVDDGLLSLMTRPGVETPAQLRGGTLAVDALTTGYAFVLKEIIRRAGIEGDVAYKAVGTGAERLQALKDGACAATLLNAPLCLAAEGAGSIRLLSARSMLGPYQGIVGAARRCFAQAHPERIVRFIRAFHRSLEWLSDPKNKTEACAILADKLPAVRAVLDEAYRMLVTEGGLARTLAIDPAGADCVIDLRRRHGGSGQELGTADRYIDGGFRQLALA